MRSNDAEVRTLRRLVREVQAEPTGQLDWSRVETRLFARVGPDASQKRIDLPNRWSIGRLLATVALVSTGVALTAAIVVFLTQPPSSAQAPNANEARLETDIHRVNARGLVLGHRLMAGTTGLEVVDPGRARWELQPHSSIRVISREQPWVLELEQGAIHVEVRKGHVPGGFAVIAGATRVSVKGTIFGVRKQKDRAVVHVERGVVEVGPVRPRPDSPSWKLDAGTQGVFTLDGQRVDVAQTARFKDSASSQKPETMSKERPRQRPQEPTIAELESGLDQVTAAITNCFRQAATPPDTVRVIIVTSLTLTVSPAGRIEGEIFSPPLSPTVPACSAQKLSAIRFAKSERGAHVTRNLELYP